MRKTILFLLLFAAFIPSMFAQGEETAKRNKMIKEGQEFRMNFVAKEMDLTDAQKQKFIPLYQEMCQKRIECFKEARKVEKKIKKESKEPSDEEYSLIMQAQNKAKEQAAAIEKEYNEKFAEFLSPKQIYKLKEAENAFTAKLEEMRHERKREHRKK